MTTQQTKVADFAVAMLVSLTDSGVGSDVLEMLTHGDSRGKVGANTLRTAIAHAFRNVAQPDAPTHSPELTARMVALCRAIAADSSSSVVVDHQDEARAIVALLDPVDGDLIEAREIGRTAAYGHNSLNEQLLVEAIKRGRALAEAGK